MSKKQRVHIISEDGTCANTQLLDAESGKPLGMRVYRIDLSVDARGYPEKPGIWEGQLHTYLPVVDILADAEIFQMCRYCKQLLPDDWEVQDTLLANVMTYTKETRELREKPLCEALDFQHDIERVRGKLAGLFDSDADDFPLGYAVAIIKKYEQVIQEFLGEDTSNDEEKQG